VSTQVGVQWLTKYCGSIEQRHSARYTTTTDDTALAERGFIQTPPNTSPPPSPGRRHSLSLRARARCILYGIGATAASIARVNLRVSQAARVCRTGWE
jgi:hypothetical protein